MPALSQKNMEEFNMQKKMQKVAILDLRGNDAWDYDWILVVRSYEFSLVTQEIAYVDKNGDYILFDGAEDEAYQFFSNYCKDNNLRLIGYDTMEENDIAENTNDDGGFMKKVKETIRFFRVGVKNYMKYHNMTLLRAVKEEIYMLFSVMGLKLYVQYANGTAEFDEEGNWINGGKKRCRKN